LTKTEPVSKAKAAAFFDLLNSPLVLPLVFSFNIPMTAEAKTSLARFLDLAAAAVQNGYRGAEQEYHFEDDAPAPAPQSPVPAPGSLAQIAAEIRSCAACPLAAKRTNAVAGEGAESPLVLVIGEGPGADEDASGRPFVGKAGQLLDKMLSSIGLSREANCFIANIVKCRPPNNRDPLPEESAACLPFLERQIQLLKPRFILCAGRIAAQTLLNTGETLGGLRGRFIEITVNGTAIPLIATYHPSALLRNEEFKRPAWEDLKLLKARMENG
jgi:DNA polymerase